MVHGVSVLVEHGEGHAGLLVGHVHDHGRLHESAVGITRRLTCDDASKGHFHGCLGVFEGETGSVVNLSGLVVVEGRAVGAAALAL